MFPNMVKNSHAWICTEMKYLLLLDVNKFKKAETEENSVETEESEAMKGSE